MKYGRLWAAESVKFGCGWPWSGPAAWTLGCRGEATARRLWQALPKRYHRRCWYFTDEWKAYAKVLPRWQHRSCPKGKGQTNVVEAINCSLHQRGGVLVRNSCSFSKYLKMHTARIKIIIDNHNRNIILIIDHCLIIYRGW